MKAPKHFICGTVSLIFLLDKKQFLRTWCWVDDKKSGKRKLRLGYTDNPIHAIDLHLLNEARRYRSIKEHLPLHEIVTYRNEYHFPD